MGRLPRAARRALGRADAAAFPADTDMTGSFPEIRTTALEAGRGHSPIGNYAHTESSGFQVPWAVWLSMGLMKAAAACAASA